MLPMHDFSLDDHGTIVLLRPETHQARVWVLENLGDNLPSIAGAIAIERRYVDSILTGLRRDALTWAPPPPTIH